MDLPFIKQLIDLAGPNTVTGFALISVAAIIWLLSQMTQLRRELSRQKREQDADERKRISEAIGLLTELEGRKIDASDIEIIKRKIFSHLGAKTAEVPAKLTKPAESQPWRERYAWVGVVLGILAFRIFSNFIVPGDFSRGAIFQTLAKEVGFFLMSLVLCLVCLQSGLGVHPILSFILTFALLAVVRGIFWW
jgi:hypothetical protein